MVFIVFIILLFITSLTSVFITHCLWSSDVNLIFPICNNVHYSRTSSWIYIISVARSWAGGSSRWWIWQLISPQGKAEHKCTCGWLTLIVMSFLHSNSLTQILVSFIPWVIQTHDSSTYHPWVTCHRSRSHKYLQVLVIHAYKRLNIWLEQASI